LRDSRLSVPIFRLLADRGVVKQALVASIVALALAPSASARPLLGVAGDGARFASLTGQRSSSSHMYLGWGQGQTWGSSFDRIFLLLHGGTAAELNARLSRLGLPGVRSDLAVNPFPQLRVVWGAQAHGDPQVPGNQPARYYPGDAFVDVVGDDPYDLGSVD